MGVIGIACPDNNPLLNFVSLLAPAIARGNSVVIVPSTKYPILALDMYQVFDTSDLPGGVVNILTGNLGRCVGFFDLICFCVGIQNLSGICDLKFVVI